jgi:hypothetical protein
MRAPAAGFERHDPQMQLLAPLGIFEIHNPHVPEMQQFRDKLAERHRFPFLLEMSPPPAYCPEGAYVVSYSIVKAGISGIFSLRKPERAYFIDSRTAKLSSGTSLHSPHAQMQGKWLTLQILVGAAQNN